MSDRTDRHGVTLVEMLVVVGVIALLAGMVVVATRGLETKSNEQIVINAFTVLKSALREYYEFTDGFPAQPDAALDSSTALVHIQLMYDALDKVLACKQVLQGIDVVLVRRTEKQPAPSKYYDPWGTPLDYVYLKDADSFPRLISAGPDRQFGTDDDINSKNH